MWIPGDIKPPGIYLSYLIPIHYSDDSLVNILPQPLDIMRLSSTYTLLITVFILITWIQVRLEQFFFCLLLFMNFFITFNCVYIYYLINKFWLQILILLIHFWAYIGCYCYRCCCCCLLLLIHYWIIRNSACWNLDIYTNY